MNQILILLKKTKDAEVSFFLVLLKYFYFLLFKKKIFSYWNCTINGIKNISTNGYLQIGINKNSFMLNSDKTLLNIKGQLIINGNNYISKGCRIDIGEKAIATFNKVFINANTLFVIKHGITIGEGTVISWNCQFIDNDFHKIYYNGKKSKENSILIGNNVWIGANTIILKGVNIPNGSVIAANSVISKSFFEENTLIGGNPAKILKENIKWEV